MSSSRVRLLLLTAAVTVLAGTTGLLKIGSHNRQALDVLQRVTQGQPTERTLHHAPFSPWTEIESELLAGRLTEAVMLFEEAGRPIPARELAASIAGYDMVEGLRLTMSGEVEAGIAAMRQSFTTSDAFSTRPVLHHYYAHLRDDAAASTLRFIQNYLDDAPLEQGGAILTPVELNGEREQTGCWAVSEVAYDPISVALGPLVHVRIVWESEDGDLVSQEQVVSNLAPNGGFEWQDGDVLPLGYELTLYEVDNPALTRSYVETERGDRALRLQNSETHYRTSLRSRLIPISADAVYFQGARLAASNASASVGHGLPALDGSSPFRYVASGVRDVEWVSVGGVVTFDAASSAINLWLLNYQAVGRVTFDDVMFFEITPPNCRN